MSILLDTEATAGEQATKRLAQFRFVIQHGQDWF